MLALVAVPALLLFPALFGSRAFVGLPVTALEPWRAALDPVARVEVREAALPLTGDKTFSCWPLLSVSLERLASGELPLWDADNLLGVPLLAQATQGALHPLNWTALLLPLERAFGWTAFLQWALAGVFACLLARSLGLDRAPSWLAGLTFMLCGYLSVRGHWYPITGAALYLPLALLAVERLFGGGRALWTGVLALAVGGALLSGFLQGAVHLCYAAALWAAARLWTTHRAGGVERVQGRRAARLAALGALLGLAIGMPQLGPSLEYVAGGESARASAEVSAIRSELAMRPTTQLLLLAPDAFLTPVEAAHHPLTQLGARGGALRAILCKTQGNAVETAGWIGLVPLLLALCGMGARGRGRVLATALFAAGLLLPLDTPLLEVVCRLPGLSQGDPRRFLVLLGLGGALLAAFGLRRVREFGAPRWLSWLTAALAIGAGAAAYALVLGDHRWPELLADPLAAVFGVDRATVLQSGDALQYDREILITALLRLSLLACATTVLFELTRLRPRARRVASGTLVLVAALDLVAHAQREVVTVDARDVFATPAQIERLADDGAAPGRLVRVHAAGAEGLIDVPLPPNTGLPFGVRDLCGYFALAPKRFVDVLETVEEGCTYDLGLAALRDPAVLASPTLELLCVSRALVTSDANVPGWRDAGTIGDARLLEREAPVPRAWFAGGRARADADEVLDDLRAGASRARAPLEPLPDGTRPEDLLDPAVFGDVPSGVPVTIAHELPESLELSLDAPVPGLVVLADEWLPGWTADVDGAPAPIVPAYHALRAVPVSAGRHVVTLRYRSAAWTPSWIAALVGLLGTIAFLVRGRRD